MAYDEKAMTREHQAIWDGFCKFMLWSVIGSAVLLGLMAAFLV
jgi:hypothetical protein